MRKVKTFAPTGVICVAILTIACGKAPVSDQAITTDIQSKLYSDSATRSAGIAVTVQNGAVTLSGDVPSPDVELQAMKIANGTAGVKGVTDQLKVAAAVIPGGPPKGDTGSSPQGEGAPLASSKPIPPPVPAEPSHITVPAGERLNVRMIDPIDSGKDKAGQVYRASLDAPIVSGNRVVVAAGSPVSVVLENVKGAGRIKGSSEVALRVASLEYQGHRYDVNSSVYEEQGKGRGKQTAVRTGIGAAAGAIIGGLAGGGKGAAIGSAAGGGAGVGYNALTHGQQIKIPSETVLNFRLEAPLKIERRR